MSDLAPITPVPLAPEGEAPDPRLRTVVLMGGTFDPVHKGHVNLPLVVRQALEREHGAGPSSVHLLYVPVARSPHKAEHPVASDEDRLAMLRLATEHLPRTSVWTDEIDRASRDPHAPSYTVDTVRRLRTDLARQGLDHLRPRLLLGADQALAFHRWRDAADLLALAPSVVMLRGQSNDASALIDALIALRDVHEKPVWSDEHLAQWRAAIKPVGEIDANSTAIRDAIRAGSGLESRMLDPRVAAFIAERGLYR